MIEPCSNCGKNYCYGDCYDDDAIATENEASAAVRGLDDGRTQ